MKATFFTNDPTRIYNAEKQHNILLAVKYRRDKTSQTTYGLFIFKDDVIQSRKSRSEIRISFPAPYQFI